jgi:hypothetical protein
VKILPIWSPWPKSSFEHWSCNWATLLWGRSSKDTRCGSKENLGRLEILSPFFCSSSDILCTNVCTYIHANVCTYIHANVCM